VVRLLPPAKLSLRLLLLLVLLYSMLVLLLLVLLLLVLARFGALARHLLCST
jgi:hypothetical protein